MRPLALALLLLGGCVAQPDPAVFRREIVGGAATSGDPAVVLLLGQEPGSDLATLCTGTVVSPHVVLTAAHCVTPSLVGSAKFSVFLGADIDTLKSASELLPVKEIHFHPDFDVNNVVGGGDVGVAIMEQALTVTPIAMNRRGLSESLVGEAARMVGYGKTSADDTSGASAGKKRVAETMMGSYTDKLVRFGRPGTTTCEGDSGGPGLMTIDGEEVVVGVVSFGDQSCAQLGVDTRVDVYADEWVQPYIDEIDPGSGGGGDDGGCAMTGAVSSHGAWLLLPLALLGLTRRRRAFRS